MPTNRNQRTPQVLGIALVILWVAAGQARPAGGHQLYLPAVHRQHPAHPAVFGAQIANSKVAATVSRASQAGLAWVRYGNLPWSKVEARRGVRDWSQLGSFEQELRLLRSYNLEPIVVVHDAPAWAQKIAGISCGPIKADTFNDFADFMYAAVQRYSAPPYGVKYWEIWNEPDVDVALATPGTTFGCWGQAQEAYFGGSYYGQMLKAVYPAIKNANPKAQVLLGGLLLSCDPAKPPAGNDCLASYFLEGILQAGGGRYFDLVSYHAYSYWGPVREDWDRIHAYWIQRGGSLLGKLDFIRAVLGQYGIDKDIFMTEGGLLCAPGSSGCPGDDFFNDQANYAVRLYARTWANHLTGAIWYTLNGPGWRDCGLLDENQQPRPAYTALQFMATLLKDADYDSNLSSGALEGYRFKQANREFRLYWTNQELAIPVELPDGTAAVYNKLGDSQAFTTTVTAGFEPLFIEIKTR